MSGRLIIVGGLPGSGKSTYFRTIKNQDNTEIYDDYRGHLLGKPNIPQLNKYFTAVLNGLRQEKEVWVCDILFGIPKYRNEFLAAVLQVLPDIKVDYHFFETDLQTCRERVKNRGRDEATVKHELELIDSITEHTSYPKLNIQAEACT